jgi:zinc protease
LIASIAVTAFAQPAQSPRAPQTRVTEHRAKVEVTYASRQDVGQGVTVAKMSNGLTVIVRENHTAPVATVRCYVTSTGSMYEGKHLGAGLSHMLEHLVAGGSTTKRTETQIREIMDSLGGQTNAYTSDEVTCFYIDCPAANTSVAIELIAQNMQFSVIPENEYVREMGVVQRELEMGEADRQRVLYHTMKQLVYHEHPKRHPTIGYLPVVQAVAREEVIGFYKDRYVPQNLVFVVVGDVQTDDVLSDTLAMFKTFQRTTERVEVLPVEPDQASPRSARLQMEGPSTHLSVAWPTVPLQNPDLYPLDVASFILTNGNSSRLTKRLKVDQALATSVSSVSNTPGGVPGWFEITVECQPKNVAQVREIVFEEVRRLQTDSVSDAELAKAKRQKSADHVFGQTTVQNQAEMLSESFRSTGDPLFDSRYVEGIQRVTAKDIQAAAKRYFVPQRLNSVVIEPLGSKAAGDAKETTQAAESPIIRKQLANGLTVLLKRQSFLPMVSIQAYAKAGALSDTAATSGLSALATEMLSKGTKKYTAAQIAEHFDSVGGTLALNSQQNTSFLQCSVLSSDFDVSFDYIHQVLAEPTFPADEFEKVRAIRTNRVAARQANPQTEIMDFFARQLPATSAYSRTALGTVETLAKLTAADCRRFHQTSFVPQNMVLAVFGDIDVEATLAKIEASFGKIKRGADVAWPDFSAHPKLPADLARHLKNQKENTGMVLIAYPTISIHDAKTRSALEMLDAVLTGGGGAGGRLHEELRGATLVYYVFGMQMIGPAPGYFVFLAQTRPENVSEVRSRIQANLDKIRREGIPAEEFALAKQKLLASHAMKNTTPSEQAFQSSIDELYGLGFDHDRSFPKRLEPVTADDVVDVVKKYFQQGVVVTSSPNASPSAK